MPTDEELSNMDLKGLIDVLNTTIADDEDARDLTFKVDQTTDYLLSFFAETYGVTKEGAAFGLLGAMAYKTLDASGLHLPFLLYVAQQNGG